MSELLGPLDREPVSVIAPFLSCPNGGYRYEPFEQRHAALLAALEGVTLGAYDERLVGWLATWDVTVVAGLVSLLDRACQAAVQRARQGGSESR